MLEQSSKEIERKLEQRVQEVRQAEMDNAARIEAEENLRKAEDIYAQIVNDALMIDSQEMEVA
jgi:hypothetical protein